MYRYFLIFLPIVACGGESKDADTDSTSGDDLTCEILEDPGFCWTTGVVEAYDCFAGTDATAGIMAPDGSGCGFDDGTTVRFDSPIPEFDSGDTWAFTVLDSGGAECAKFVEVETDFDTGFKLTVGSGSYETNAGLTYSVDCADGTSHQTTDVFGLLECDFSSLPGYSSSSSGTGASFSILPAPTGSSGLFSCQ